MTAIVGFLGGSAVVSLFMIQFWLMKIARALDHRR